MSKIELPRAKGKSPCYGCEKRQIGCHANCAEYAGYRAEQDAFKKARINQSIVDSDIEFKAHQITEMPYKSGLT